MVRKGTSLRYYNFAYSALASLRMGCRRSRRDAGYCGRPTRRTRSWKRGSERSASSLRSALRKYGDVGGFFLEPLLQKFECLVLVAQSSVYRRNHVRRHIVSLGLSQQITEYLLRLSPSAHRRIGVCQSSDSIRVAVRQF